MHTDYRPLFTPWNIKEEQEQEKKELRQLYKICGIVIVLFLVVVL